MSEEILTGDIPDEEEEGEFIGGFDDDGEGIFGDIPEMSDTTDPFAAIETSQTPVVQQQPFRPTMFTQNVVQTPTFVVQAPRISGHATEINIQNCQLCRQVFLNRQLLLDHVHTFHNIDTGHVLAGSAAIPSAAATNSASSGPTRVQQLPVNAIRQPNIVRLSPARTTNTLAFQAVPGAAPGVRATFRIQPLSSVGQTSVRPPVLINQPRISISQLIRNKQLQQAQGISRLTPVLNRPSTALPTTASAIPQHLKTALTASGAPLQTSRPSSQPFMPIAAKSPVVLAKELNFENAASSSVRDGPKSKYVLASDSGVGYNCRECWRHFTTIVEAENHVAEVHSANQKCKFCGETFLDLDFLQVHLEVSHNGKTPTSLANAEDTGEQLDASAKPVSPEIITLSDDDEAVGAPICDIPKPRESVSMAAASPVPQSTSPTPACHTTSYLKYVSLNGYLTQEQLEFAGKMIESEGTFARCKICNNKYSSMFHAKSHVRHTHLREYHKCAICERRFKSKLKRDQHRVEAHPEAPTGNFSTKSPLNPSRPSSANPVNAFTETWSQEKMKSLTTGVFNAPVFVNSAVQSLITPSSKTHGFYACERCKKEFKAQKYCMQHVRAVHFSKSNLCSRCLCFYENVLLHRLCCTGDSTGATKFVPSVESLVSVMEDIVVTGNYLGQEAYSCRLCNKRYDRKYFTESHIWLEHCRSLWTALAGAETAETVYEQFIQHQKVVNPHQPVMQQFLGSQTQAGPVVPANLTPIEASDSVSVLTPEVSWHEDDFDPTLQCEVEFADEESSNLLQSEDVTDDHTITSGTVRSQLGKELTPEELLNWSRKALKYIREKGGKFVCIICQEVSKLRTSLVDHVRETHLLKRQATGSGEIQQPIASENGPDRRMCTICSEDFQTVIERENHETFCATTREYVDTPGERSIVPQPPTIVQSRKTSSLDRAMKFTKQEGREYACTVCSVRATKMYRLLAHIISIHFGEEPTETDKNKCGGCGRNFATPGAKSMHVKHCKVSKLKKMNQSLKQVNTVNHPPPVVKPTEPTKATAVVEPQRSRYGRSYGRREDPIATAKSGSERSNLLVPDTWNSDLTGLLPYKVAEHKFLRCTACEVLIPDTQNGDDNLRKFHGGIQLYNCTKCEAVFLTGTVRDEHQIGCQQEITEEETEAPSSPNIGYENDGGADDYSHPGTPSPPSPEVHVPMKSALKKVSPKKKSSPSAAKKIKAVAKSIVKKYATSKVTRNAKVIVPQKLQKATEYSPISAGGHQTPRSTRYRMLSSKNDTKVTKLMKPVRVRGLLKYRCAKCTKQPSRKNPLEIHIRVVHFKEKPLGCVMCQETFSNWKALNKHFNNRHPESRENDESDESDVKSTSPEPKKICIEKFQCKLCKDTCNDIPMVRFHLVSEHSGELQAMGKADKLFNDAEKVAESLSVPVRVEITPDISEQQYSKATTASRRKQKPGPVRSKSKPSRPTASLEAESVIDWRTLSPPKVFVDERVVLQSIKSDDRRTPPCTVRIELLRAKHPMPEIMLGAARRAIDKVMPRLYLCQLCNKQFQTSSGSMKHARRVHLGEYIQCQSCQKTFNEENRLASHEITCAKMNKAPSSVKEKPPTKSRSPAPGTQNYANFPGGLDPDLLSSIMPLAPISRPGPASSKKKLKKKKKKVSQAAIKFNFAKKSTD